jgi:hypothetical protein
VRSAVLVTFAVTILVSTAPAQNRASSPSPTIKQDGIIQPGVSVGRLRLGDTHEQILALLPLKPNQDQDWYSECGTQYVRVDEGAHRTAGTVGVTFNGDRAFQIETSNPRYSTPEGINAESSPEKIKQIYKGLRAYQVDVGQIEAYGDRPLVVWADSESGIAFVFAYSRSEERMTLLTLVVFKPQMQFCVGDAMTSTSKWHEIAPYSLETSTLHASPPSANWR